MEIVRGPKDNSNNKDIYLLKKIHKESTIMYNCLTLIKLLLTNGCFRFEFVGSGADLYCTGTTHTNSWETSMSISMFLCIMAMTEITLKVLFTLVQINKCIVTSCLSFRLSLSSLLPRTWTDWSSLKTQVLKF